MKLIFPGQGPELNDVEEGEKGEAAPAQDGFMGGLFRLFGPAPEMLKSGLSDLRLALEVVEPIQSEEVALCSVETHQG